MVEMTNTGIRLRIPLPASSPQTGIPVMILPLFGGLFAISMGLLIWQVVHLTLVLKWADEKTDGNAYYGLPAAERKRFAQQLQFHALLLTPILWVLAKCTKFNFQRASFSYRGVAGPAAGACTPESFRRASEYRPRREDVFVVTQMRCGTTWMQHLTYQVLTRGQHDLAAEDLTLNAVSPWIESTKTVSVEDSPVVGNEVAARIIKTHLPTSLCPFNTQAKYIYVARHPASCFASCADFVRSNLHRFRVETEALADWFLTDEAMWWSTWSTHLSGWWDVAQANENVLMVRFEDMKQDLGAVTQQVADFLGMAPLNENELANVVHRCSFAEMQQHDDVFEMHPPHVLQTPGRFFVSGKADRYRDVSPEVRDRIIEECAEQLSESAVPIEELYPDVLVGHDVSAAHV